MVIFTYLYKIKIFYINKNKDIMPYTYAIKKITAFNVNPSGKCIVFGG